MRVEVPLNVNRDLCRCSRDPQGDSAGRDRPPGLHHTADPSTDQALRAYASMSAELVALTLDELATDLDGEARRGGHYGPGLALAALILRDRAAEALIQADG